MEGSEGRQERGRLSEERRAWKTGEREGEEETSCKRWADDLIP